MTSTRHRFPSDAALTPPRFVVDLSLPPQQRYTHIAGSFESELGALPELYQDVLSTITPPWLASILTRLSPLMLRKVYDREETAELRGISAATGMPMYLLVAFNVLLDLFMGCTSGGVRVRDRIGGSKMLHFRALDWGMDPLRKIVMEVDFVQEKDGPVVATSVTYFGYVGVLTGVRPGLSLSLNFRPHHDGAHLGRHVNYGGHLLLVLLGWRRSISSALRGYLLGSLDTKPQLDSLISGLQDQKSTAAYLIFSNGQRTVTMEKDNGSSKLFADADFIVTLNHDIADEKHPESVKSAAADEPATMAATGMLDLVSGSLDRKRCAVKLVEKSKKTRRQNQLPEWPLEEEEVVGWMEGNHIVNDETHYAVIMDPDAGNVIWLQRWRDPLDMDADMGSRRVTQGTYQKKALRAARDNQKDCNKPTESAAQANKNELEAKDI